ncbi:MAG: hypothetical protein CVV57_04440 [Tenericutes bacterium HGW-Tenericutes-2]|jgi:hypothetical protein|nr:MAG: hypothetical protein CVV57_04440 [Tenericutes bacterium HGW-Tenericutes-2]
MKDVHVISIIALIYSVILALVTLIFFNDYLLWAILGSAVALFNHSLMIQVTKNKLTSYKLVTHLIQRYVFYIVILAIVYFDTRNLGTDIMIQSYVFLLLGIASIKFGAIIYQTPLIKKPKEAEVKTNDTDSN